MQCNVFDLFVNLSKKDPESVLIFQKLCINSSTTLHNAGTPLKMGVEWWNLPLLWFCFMLYTFSECLKHVSTLCKNSSTNSLFPYGGNFSQLKCLSKIIEMPIDITDDVIETELNILHCAWVLTLSKNSYLINALFLIFWMPFFWMAVLYL